MIITATLLWAERERLKGWEKLPSQLFSMQVCFNTFWMKPALKTCFQLSTWEQTLSVYSTSIKSRALNAFMFSLAQTAPMLLYIVTDTRRSGQLCLAQLFLHKYGKKDARAPFLCVRVTKEIRLHS